MRFRLFYSALSLLDFGGVGKRSRQSGRSDSLNYGGRKGRRKTGVTMVEFIWGDKRVALLRVAPPLQTVETVNASDCV